MKRSALTRSIFVAFAAIGSIVAAWACSPATVAGPADAGSDSAIIKACNDFGFAYCTRLQACSGTTLELRFKDFTTCQTIYSSQCKGSGTVPSTGSTPAGEEACVAAIPNWTCTDFLVSRNSPPACTVAAGQLPIGATCSNRQQCQSAYCGVPNGAACGACQPPVTIGDSCATTPCQEGLTCEGTTCVEQSELGSACNANQPCIDGLTCVAGICVQGIATLNAACVFNGAGCNSFDGLSCNVQLGTCQTTALVQPGGACGTVGNQATACISGSCLRGVCVGNIGYQQPCELDGGAACISATHCISVDGGAQGTCEVYGTYQCQ